MAYLCLRFLPLVVATAVLGTLRSSNAFMSCVCTLPESRNACQRLAIMVRNAMFRKQSGIPCLVLVSE